MDIPSLRLTKKFSNVPLLFSLLFARVIGYFRQEFFIVFKFWLVGVVLSVVVRFPAALC